MSLHDTMKQVFEARYANDRDWYVNEIIADIKAVYTSTFRYVERRDGGVEDWSDEITELIRSKFIRFVQKLKDEEGLRRYFPLVRNVEEDAEDPESPGGPPWTSAELSTPDEEEAYGLNRRDKSVRDADIASGHINRARRRRRRRQQQQRQTA